MKDMNELIIQALKPIAPVAFHEYMGTEKTYITFMTYFEGEGMIADDTEITTQYSVQIDVYSTGNTAPIVKAVKESLKPYGFKRSSVIEMYERNTKTYRKLMTFKVALPSDYFTA